MRSLFLRHLFLAVSVPPIFLSAGAAIAQPVPELSTIPPSLVITPDGSATYTVIIAGSNGPIAGVTVEITFPFGADDLIAWAPGPVFTDITDVNGIATFNLAGAGCVEPSSFGADVVWVTADSEYMGSAWIVSPDAVNGQGLLPTALGAPICEPEGKTVVGLSDLWFHLRAIKLGIASPCTDFNGSGAVDVSDAAFLSPYIVTGTEGACSPAGPPVPTTSNENAVVALHARSWTSKAACSLAPTIPCSDYTTTWPPLTSGYVYLVAARGDSAEGLAGISCGISYDDSPSGLFVDWFDCSGGALSASETLLPASANSAPSWPSSGSGIRTVWSPAGSPDASCQRTVRGSDGVHAIAGAFYVYSYGNPVEFSVTENPNLATPELRVIDCSGVESPNLPMTRAARVAFSSSPTTFPGYNPCDCDELVCFTSSLIGQGATQPDSAQVVLTLANCSSYQETVNGSLSVEGSSSQAIDITLAPSTSQDITFYVPCESPDTLTVIATYLVSIGTDTSCSMAGSETTEVVCSPPPSCLGDRVPAPGDIVAWWSFDQLISGEVLPLADLVHPGSKKNWGTPVAGASLVPGFVGNGLRCEAAADGVQIPHSVTSGLNFVNKQSFGIDAWVFPRSGAPPGERRVIVDKSKGNWSGYTFYVVDGKLGMEVQRPGNPGVYETSALVTDDAWHLVVVVADRSGFPAQSHLQFFLDGVLIHSVDASYFEAAGTTDLYIGRAGDGDNPSGPFTGEIDEVEIWSPPPDSSTIGKLWLAGCAGKRKEYVRLPMVSPQCQNDGNATVCAILCNMSTESQTYDWSAALAPIGPGCPSAALTFNPDHGTLSVDAGTCVAIPIVIQATGTAPFTTCYNVEVVNLADPQHPFSASGSIHAPAGKLCAKNTKCSAKLIEPTGASILSTGGQVVFRVYNDSTHAVPFDYTLIGVNEATRTVSQRMSMNGQPPGTPISGTVLVPPADSADVTVAAAVDTPSPFFTESVLLLRDLPGRRDSLATTLVEFPEDTTSSVTGVPEDGVPAISTRIHASPNPFTSRTSFDLALVKTEDVEATVYDVTGRRVRQLYKGRLPAGVHRFGWDGLDVSGGHCRSGVYFIRVVQGTINSGAKVFLLR